MIKTNVSKTGADGCAQARLLALGPRRSVPRAPDFRNDAVCFLEALSARTDVGVSAKRTKKRSDSLRWGSDEVEARVA